MPYKLLEGSSRRRTCHRFRMLLQAARRFSNYLCLIEVEIFLRHSLNENIIVNHFLAIDKDNTFKADYCSDTTLPSNLSANH